MAIDVAHPFRSKPRPPRHLRMAPQEAPATRAPFDRDYWIGHSEGYRVDGPDGRIGFVEEVRANPADPESPLLAVRAGRLGTRVLVVPADAIEFIVPREQRIWLRAPIRIVTSEAA
jgi:hypothetical protein